MNYIEKLGNGKNMNHQELSTNYRQVLDQFAVHLTLQQLAHKTLQRKIFMAGKFLLFIQKLNINDIGIVSADIINTFLCSVGKETSRIKKQITSAFHAQYYVSIKDFFGFLYGNKMVLVNPTEKITPPQKDKPLPRHILSRDEIQKILDRPNIKTYHGLMARTLLEVMYGCGLRTGEICNLTLDDLNLKSGTIHIRDGKGSKDRIIPIGDVAKSWVEKYLEVRRPLQPDLRELFLTDRDNKPLRNDYISRTIRKYVRKAGIDKKIVPHSFRHTYATHLLEEGVSIRYIQALLGHSTLDATQIYTHVANTDLKKLHSMLHPRKNHLVENKEREG